MAPNIKIIFIILFLSAALCLAAIAYLSGLLTI